MIIDHFNSFNNLPESYDDFISIYELVSKLGDIYNLNIDFKDRISNKKKDIYIPDITMAKKKLNLINKYSTLDAIFKTINTLKRQYAKIN
jgi:hypothetical protein